MYVFIANIPDSSLIIVRLRLVLVRGREVHVLQELQLGVDVKHFVQFL